MIKTGLLEQTGNVFESGRTTLQRAKKGAQKALKNVKHHLSQAKQLSSASATSGGQDWNDAASNVDASGGNGTLTKVSKRSQSAKPSIGHGGSAIPMAATPPLHCYVSPLQHLPNESNHPKVIDEAVSHRNMQIFADMQPQSVSATGIDHQTSPRPPNSDVDFAERERRRLSQRCVSPCNVFPGSGAAESDAPFASQGRAWQQPAPPISAPPGMPPPLQQQPSEANLNGGSSSFYARPGTLFLQYQGETKRAQFTEEILSLDDIRSLFLKTFPNSLNADYLNLPTVKIYIQDPTRLDFFYELDNLRELKDRTVLKLHEQPSVQTHHHVSSSMSLSSPYHHEQPRSNSITPTLPRLSATPGPFAGAPLTHSNSYAFELDDINYFSESELDSPLRRLRGSVGPVPPKSYTPAPYLSSSAAKRFGSQEQQAQSAYYQRLRNGSATTAADGQERNFGAPPKPSRLAYNGNTGRGDQRSRNGLSCNANRNSLNRTPTDSRSELEAIYGNSGQQMTTNARSFGSSSISSDGSAGMSRSGSVTPVIDEETRMRMDNMEKQLASLSSLVHTALGGSTGINRSVTESVYKEVQALKREILGGSEMDAASDSGSVSRFSDLSSDKGGYKPDKDFMQPYFVVGSNGHSATRNLNPEIISGLKRLKKQANEVQHDLKSLRTAAQTNAQMQSAILNDAFEKLKSFICSKSLSGCNLCGGSSDSGTDGEQEQYRQTVANLESELHNLERQVEGLRQNVINGSKKLRVFQVEGFTTSLTHIGRTAATLKGKFQTLEERVQKDMATEMEKVVKKEKFLRHEPERIDNALRRCNKLTSTIITMKKLAIVQDPSLPPPSINHLNGSHDGKAFEGKSLPEGGLPPGIIRSPSAPIYGQKAVLIAQDTQRNLEAADGPNPQPPTLMTPEKDFGSRKPNGLNVDQSDNKPSSPFGTTSILRPRKSSLDAGIPSVGSNTSELDSLLEELQTAAGGTERPEQLQMPPPKPLVRTEKRVGFLDQVRTDADSPSDSTTPQDVMRKSTYDNAPAPPFKEQEVNFASSTAVDAKRSWHAASFTSTSSTAASSNSYLSSSLGATPVLSFHTPQRLIADSEFSTPPTSPNVNTITARSCAAHANSNGGHMGLMSESENSYSNAQRLPVRLYGTPQQNGKLQGRTVNRLGSVTPTAEIANAPYRIHQQPFESAGIRPLFASNGLNGQFANMEQRNGQHPETQNSISAEPGSIQNAQKYPPPPPQRMSSNSRVPASAIYENGPFTNGSGLKQYSRDDVRNLKTELRSPGESDYAAYGYRQATQPIVQTNAVNDEDPRNTIRSASSTESINSQDGAMAPAIPPPPLAIRAKAPPPPPPARSKAPSGFLHALA